MPPTSPTVLLTSGGLRSLVALSLAAAAERPRLVLVHLKDGRTCAPARLEHLRRQAEHFRLSHLIELELPHLHSRDTAAGRCWGALVRPQILLSGLAQALELGASRLIWPAQVDGQLDAIARLTEQIELALHLAGLETDGAALPAIEAPLLELTDRQMIELGAQAEAPWALAWTCLMPSPQPCRQCPGCRRRRAAFQAAGVADPLQPQPAAARAG